MKNNNSNPSILFIAGLDPSGNAGLLRDLQVISHFPLKPLLAVTALTSQSRSRFFASNVVSPSVFGRELLSVKRLSQFAAVKIGMLGNVGIIKKIILFLRQRGKRPPIVLDPVYQSTTGGVLLTPAGRKLLWEKLLPLVSLWTPNCAEASFFSGIEINSQDRMEGAAKKLWEKKGVPVLIKGVIAGATIFDFFQNGNEKIWFKNQRIPGRYRGLGCALSSLIASHLAMGRSLSEAVKKGRKDMVRLRVF